MQRFFVSETFSAGVIHGMLVTVTPDGWRVARRGAPVASGPETGNVGLALALSAVGDN